MIFIDMFCGIGGFRLGLEKASEKSGGDLWESSGRVNIRQGWDSPNLRYGTRGQSPTFNCVWANDNDKYACQIYRKRFGDKELYEGGIRAVDIDTIPEHNLLCAGFPCQDFSIAGRRAGIEGTRGTLFFEICRVLRAKRPGYVFLENVKGLLSADNGRAFGVILSSLDELGYDYQWQVLNSKDYGVPQNRERVFIIGHLRGKPRSKVFPIGEDGDEYNTQGRLEETQYSTALTARYHKIGQSDQLVYEGAIMSEQNQRWLQDGKELSRNFPQGQRVYSTEGIASSICGDAGGLGGKSGLYEIKPVAIRAFPRTGSNDKDRKQRIEVRKDDIANAITGFEKDSMVIHNLQPRTGNPKQGGTGHLSRKDDTAYNLDSNAGQVIEMSNKIRRLTPLECERLQGFPDGWTEGISDTQRYKCLGNAVTVNVIGAIGRQLLE